MTLGKAKFLDDYQLVNHIYNIIDNKNITSLYIDIFNYEREHLYVFIAFDFISNNRHSIDLFYACKYQEGVSTWNSFNRKHLIGNWSENCKILSHDILVLKSVIPKYIKDWLLEQKSLVYNNYYDDVIAGMVEMEWQCSIIILLQGDPQIHIDMLKFYTGDIECILIDFENLENDEIFELLVGHIDRMNKKFPIQRMLQIRKCFWKEEFTNLINYCGNYEFIVYLKKNVNHDNLDALFCKLLTKTENIGIKCAKNNLKLEKYIPFHV